MPDDVDERPTIDDLREHMEAESIESEEEAEDFRIQYLGRNQGAIPALFDQIGDLPPEERPEFGKRLNALKERAQERLDEAKARLKREAQSGGPDIDRTLPGRRGFRGSTHPLTQTLDEILRILRATRRGTCRTPSS